jgi:glucose/arabinose dehydrogenase
VTNDDARVLSDRQRAQHGLYTSKHVIGVRTEEKNPGFLRSLPESTIAVWTRSRADRVDDLIEVEIGINVFRQTDAVEIDRQTLVCAELPQNAILLSIDQLGALRRTRLLQRFADHPDPVVEVRELDLDIRELDAPELIQLRPAAGDLTEVRPFEYFQQRILVPLTSGDGLDVLEHPGNHDVWKGHGHLGYVSRRRRNQENLMHVAIRAAALMVAVPALMFAQTRPSDVTLSPTNTVRFETLATLEFPWGMALLPDGRVLITEKPGRLRIFANGQLSAPVENVPAVAYQPKQGEQGGLLDVAVDPEFEKSHTIYLSYSEETPQKSPEPHTADPRFGNFLDLKDTRLMGGAVMRAKLDGNRLTDTQVIWRQEPKTIARGHFGHRLVFGRDATLFITSGDRMRFDPAQSPSSNLGKVVRINRDGSIPKDNPFVGKTDARGDIWSLGHRNMLAAAVHPSTGELWVVEMGPLGGDELNRIERGANYGWPVVSNGDNYDKSAIPDHPTRSEFKAPARTWTPVISPSGATFYDGSLFPSWRGSLIVGGLSSKALIRLTLDGAKVAAEERIDMQRRIRDVLQARDGALLVITDEKDGALLRVAPGSTNSQ